MAARFTVDGKGSLTADSPDAQRALAVRPGFYSLLPTAADWIALVRSPMQGSTAERPRVVLSGDAGVFPLSDFIAFLNQARWSGVLRLYAPNGERALFFSEGDVRGALSEDVADRLGEVMIRLGYVQRQQVDEVLEQHPPSKVGRALVEKGVLQAHDVFRCVTQQVSDIFHAIVTCRQGLFVLVDQDLDERAGQSIQLSTQSLLMDSVRQVDEMAHFRKRIPHSQVQVTRKRPSDGKLEEVEERVLALVDGQRTVLALAQAAKLSEFDATKTVYRLLEGGYASVADKKAEAAQQSGRSSAGRSRANQNPTAMVRVFNLIFREIRDEMAKQRMDREFIAAANAALAGQALSPSPVLTGLQFGADGTLAEARILSQFEAAKDSLGTEPLASLKQAMSDVMFFLLFQAGELLESRADEELARRVKELLTSVEND